LVLHFLRSGFTIRYIFLYTILRYPCLGGGAVATAAIAYNYLTPEERRHTLRKSVSIGVHGRRIPGLNLLVVGLVWLSIEGR
jgi:hypothetical protein